jgi:hypothetical protein
VQLCRYFVSRSSEFFRHNPFCCFSTSVSFCCLFRYDSVRKLLDTSSYEHVECRYEERNRNSLETFCSRRVDSHYLQTRFDIINCFILPTFIDRSIVTFVFVVRGWCIHKKKNMVRDVVGFISTGIKRSYKNKTTKRPRGNVVLLKNSLLSNLCRFLYIKDDRSFECVL